MATRGCGGECVVLTRKVALGSTLALAFSLACERAEPPPAGTGGALPTAPPATPVAPPVTTEGAQWPVTCDDAATRALSKLGPALEQRLRALKKDQLILLHDSFGLSIRNQFGLWSGNEALVASCAPQGDAATRAPDSVSMIIITRAWEMLHGQRKAPHGDL